MKKKEGVKNKLNWKDYGDRKLQGNGSVVH